MANTLRVKFIGWATLLLLLLFSAGAYGAGDCNSDGAADISDLVFLLSYLFSGGATPGNFAECDCDGFPGVNFGDALQIAGILYGGGLYPWPGNDQMAPAATSIMISGQVDGTTKTKCFVFINNPTALNGGCTLPFSFAAKPGETDLNCIRVTAGPRFSADIKVNIDNVAKTFLLSSRQYLVPATTGWEVLCEADFIPQAGGSSGNAVTVEPTTIGKIFPLLIKTRSYNGVDYQRMLFPQFVPDAFGTLSDLNCDGAVDITDAVYMSAYIFSGGHKPGDPDGDGVPDCPSK
jgi:hypothetical protein